MNLTERRAQLENLGVHDLRNIGRMWGVPSPTLMKKEQLIDAIVQVMSGEKTFVIKSHAGRPVKNKLMGRFHEDLFPKELINFAEKRNKDSFLIDRFLPFANSEEESDFSGVLENKSGYLVKHNQYHYFCAQDDKLTHVPDVLVAQFGLIIGDYIKAIVSGASGKNYYLARDIEEINHKSSLEFVRKLCPIKDVVLSNKEIINNIKEGSK
ncbi:MAG: Rho termination factor N-terminal domain-containing protein, partial [Clostridia bacterium]|nr:Rho termination factor N-terminal domain-containing protein [Clostridia bacterium]